MKLRPIVILLTVAFLTGCANRKQDFSENIRAGYRALTLELPHDSSLNGVMSSGDLVDIIATVDLKQDQGLTTKTILNRVQVIKVENLQNRDLITLLLTPDEVELVVFSYNSGKLHLSMLNPKESDPE